MDFSSFLAGDASPLFSQESLSEALSKAQTMEDVKALVAIQLMVTDNFKADMAPMDP